MRAGDTVEGGGRVGVLLAAGTAAWEKAAMAALAASGRRTALVRRCLDLTDLLAAAAAGTAQVAVVSDRLPGVDADAVDRLARCGVRTVVVLGPWAGEGPGGDVVRRRTRLLRMGVATVVDEGAVGSLAEHVAGAAAQELGRPGGADPDERAWSAADLLPELAGPEGPGLGEVGEGGRLLTVWGPHGAPGRTTVAVGLAAEAATRGLATLLVDADPYGGAVAQHLAVLDEVSGLLAAARLANAGELDAAALAGVAREVGPGLRLLTGLPRPRRWREVRPQPFAELLEVARALDPLVVVDAGPGVPDDAADAFGGTPGRDEVSVAAVVAADAVVAVGSADPVGLTALSRSLLELVELRGDDGVHVVVNRMRPSLGWSESQVRDLVGSVVPGAAVAFLPDDRQSADRAMVSGRTLVASGDGPLRRAVAALVSELVAELGCVPPSVARPSDRGRPLRPGRRRLLRR